MKVIYALLVGAWISVLLACGSAAAATAEPGVSHELAQMRSAKVSGLHYDLSFNIPDTLGRPVSGECVMRFRLSGAVDLPVDYTGLPEGGEVRATVNGKELSLYVRNGHLTLPEELLLEGANEVTLPFVSNDKTLNRHDDYLYSLFVPANARSVFPCFDQPDLKATFSVKADAPDGWMTVHSACSRPIPTYLFSLVAGRFRRAETIRGRRAMTACYRETDPKKEAQIQEVFDMADLSLRWLEEYTGIPYPFDSYDLVILPGYQFGGMEHPGAIQLNDRTIFLSDDPTPAESLKRFNLIAHETAHMWFGDFVTMRWFDDVWTKEVFANFLADKMSREQFPDINHDLNFVCTHFPAALSTDRTEGTHPIQQSLDNLDSAGLLYGNIIYHKAPVMMRKVEDRIGADRLQSALQTYLHRYGYSNATWDDLIAIMDSVAPDGGMKEFDRLWVKQAGIPACDTLPALESMPYTVIPLSMLPSVEEASVLYGGDDATSEVRRMVYAVNLFENHRKGNLSAEDAFEYFAIMLSGESNHLIADALCTYMCSAYDVMPLSRQSELDGRIWEMAQTHPLASVRLVLKRFACVSAIDPEVIAALETLWRAEADAQLSRRDYTAAAWHLALMNPDSCQSILSLQRSRLATDDERMEFDYVARACTPDKEARQELFDGLMLPSNRVNEPWARTMLGLLCDKTREEVAIAYLRPGLDNLQAIQRTSDIFFPGYWLQALFSGMRSDKAAAIVNGWLGAQTGCPDALVRKVKENASRLLASCNTKS